MTNFYTIQEKIKLVEKITDKETKENVLNEIQRLENMIREYEKYIPLIYNSYNERYYKIPKEIK